MLPWMGIGWNTNCRFQIIRTTTNCTKNAQKPIFLPKMHLTHPNYPIKKWQSPPKKDCARIHNGRNTKIRPQKNRTPPLQYVMLYDLPIYDRDLLSEFTNLVEWSPRKHTILGCYFFLWWKSRKHQHVIPRQMPNGTRHNREPCEVLTQKSWTDC